MQVKTSELNDNALDWAVAKCEGWDAPICKNPGWAVPLYVATNDIGLFTYSPSTNWSQGGPIIESEVIDVWSSGIKNWSAKDAYRTANGPTPLIAAMRCYVKSKIGDIVEIPDELM